MAEPLNHRLGPFRDSVWRHYREHARSFPWRESRDPYAIFVSEIMLQQTQAERVVPKYILFLNSFPTVTDLARAPQADILRLWSGLGYNRRALALKRAAEDVVEHHSGVIPGTYEGLLALPGVGPYTANAILAFAYNQPVVVIETNIRSVFIHEFFPEEDHVADSKLLPLIAASVDSKDPASWYQALMDYGAFIKRQGINPSRRSRHHLVQAPFKGSLREARGVLLKTLSSGPHSLREITTETGIDQKRLDSAAASLIKEGFIVQDGKALKLR